MTVYYLEMTSPADLAAPAPVDGLQLERIDPPDPATSRRFYLEVGGAWNWTDRAEWPLVRWERYVADHPMVTTIIRLDDREAGYAEMRNLAGEVEIVNFGLLAPFIGRGLGAASLAEVVRFAWTLPAARRVWLHTCDDDHPHALANYQRRGFAVYKREQF